MNLRVLTVPMFCGIRQGRLVFGVGVVIALACTQDTVPLRSIVAHPSDYRDSAVTVEAMVTSNGTRVPLSNVVIRQLVDGTDTMTIVALPDTVTLGKKVRVRGRIYVQDVLGLARLGPIFVVGDLTGAFGDAMLRKIP